MAGTVRAAGTVPWRRQPALYREHALFITASADQAHEQLACGARVIMIGSEPVADAVKPAGDVWDGLALREQIAALQACVPLYQAEILPVLREIFTGQATPVRLAALARLAGLGDRMIVGRRIAVLARAADAAAGAALSAGLTRQRFAPAELVVVAEAPDATSAELSARAVTAALGDLADRGVSVRAVPVVTGGPDTAGVPGPADLLRPYGDPGSTGDLDQQATWDQQAIRDRAAGCGAPRAWPVPRGSCRGRPGASTTTVISWTWPARGSARRPTRPGTPAPPTRSARPSSRRWRAGSSSPPPTRVAGYGSFPSVN